MNENELELLHKILEMEHLDRSSLLRKWILEKIEEYFMQKYGESFHKGECSLEEAANQAGVSLWRMIDYVRKHNLWPRDSLEDALLELKHAKNLGI
ncbi:MAG: hypothetical protein EAX96_19160 [Candidatus Lokiarchaeota archaeon]|nr:hypothetical protein [Candidatus Lokiarchaeota archaeon]